MNLEGVARSPGGLILTGIKSKRVLEAYIIKTVASKAERGGKSLNKEGWSQQEHM